MTCAQIYINNVAQQTIVAAALLFGWLVGLPQTYADSAMAVWTNFYNGPGNGDDAATAIAVDSNGNALVTGYSSDAGARFNYATIKYSKTGAPLWIKPGPANGDYGAAVAVDSSGNVFVTGGSLNSNLDYATIKYSGAGVPLWSRFYNGSGNGDDGASAMALDASGNVFVTGYSYTDNFSYDCTTLAYSGAGQPLWTASFTGPGVLPYGPSPAIAVDSNGSVYVTGSSTDCGGGYLGYETVKYSGAGLPQWSNCYAGPGSGDSKPSAIAVDGSGNVFVTGAATAGGGDFDYATVAYSSTGVPLWTNSYNGPGNTNDVATAIAVDSSGNVLVTGYSSDITGKFSYATIKYSGAGVPLWTNYFNETINTDSVGAAIAVDSNGNVFVTGPATIAYSGEGVPLWTNRFGLGHANAILVASSSNVFVTGQSWNGSNYDYVTIMYSSANVARPYLNIQRLNDQTVLSWTNTGFSLQSASAITGSFTNIPAATSPYTNSIIGSQQYFRLTAR